jgi:hypothetical protein
VGIVAYAERTAVPVGRSRLEIETMLAKQGADAFAFGWENGRAVVTFRLDGRYVRFEVPPAAAEGMTPNQVAQAERTRWRALMLVIKAKLEAVSAGIETTEEAFLPHVVMPDGSTVKDWLAPQLEQAYATGEMPPLLPALGRGDG